MHRSPPHLYDVTSAFRTYQGVTNSRSPLSEPPTWTLISVSNNLYNQKKASFEPAINASKSVYLLAVKSETNGSFSSNVPRPTSMAGCMRLPRIHEPLSAHGLILPSIDSSACRMDPLFTKAASRDLINVVARVYFHM